MAGSGRLQADPLFIGLSRPEMIMGVGFTFVVLNFAVSLMTFINTSDFRSFLMLFGLHAVGYLICRKEPRALDLLILKARFGIKCLNKRYHGHTNSYDIY